MRTAIFGGSFNPIHNGHIQLARAFIDRLSLDRVLIVPTFVPPHKSGAKMADSGSRLEMCRIALENVPKIEVSDIEIRRGGASFTYLTLEELHALYPEDELFLITGADMFLSIEGWRNPETIFSLATICGVPRNDSDIGELMRHSERLRALGAKTEVFDAGIMTVSSTEVRRRVRSGGDISELVPPGVRDYIYKNGLYQN